VRRPVVLRRERSALAASADQEAMMARVLVNLATGSIDQAFIREILVQGLVMRAKQPNAAHSSKGNDVLIVRDAEPCSRNDFFFSVDI
jgi:hypothetical protein